MSHTTSPSMHRPYGVVRVCQEWGLIRSTCYQQRTCGASGHVRQARAQDRVHRKVLTRHIHQVLATSPFLGEGHRKV